MSTSERGEGGGGGAILSREGKREELQSSVGCVERVDRDCGRKEGEKGKDFRRGERRRYGSK